MDEIESDIYEKITNKLIDCLGLQNPIWLLDEVKNLLRHDPKLLNLAANNKVESIADAIDQYFDNDRLWSSPRIISYAEKLQNYNKQEWQKLSLFNFINAGLMIKLAIFALEETKYRNQEGPIVDLCYLSGIFHLNTFYRESSFLNNSKRKGSGSSESEKDVSTIKSPSLSSTFRKPKP